MGRDGEVSGRAGEKEREREREGAMRGLNTDVCCYFVVVLVVVVVGGGSFAGEDNRRSFSKRLWEMTRLFKH